MLRTRWCLIPVLLFATFMLAIFRYSITTAASLQQESSLVNEAGQEYIVQPEDWLSRISQKFYGSTSAWQVIVDATNTKAATDPRFTMIEDPDTLEVGQLLWLPNIPSDIADSEAISDTVQVGGATISNSVQTSSVTMSATVRFVEPQDGGEVPSPFDVTMAAEGLTVEPAGEINEGAGHFHILVDTDFIASGELLPFDENHLHFGKGQLTTTLELEPGVHTLSLQFANGAHIALEGAQYQDTITVTVSSEKTVLPGIQFVAPVDGAVVTPRFDVTMAAEGLTVEPAGEINEGAGHFHILVDTDFIASGELLPFDENHLHFGKGQLTTTLELEPGVHTLSLQFANGAHIALEGAQYQDIITVTVGSGY